MVAFRREPLRPENVIGQFEDLSEETKSRVMEVCVEALRTVLPTPIPDGNSFPSAIVYEGEAFAKALQAGASYTLDAEQIRKWLPAVLRGLGSDSMNIVARCIQVSREATEEVLLTTICREVRSGGEGGYTAADLPVESWSKRLIEGVLAIINDESFPVSGRCSLLRVLATRDRDAFTPVARRWLADSVSNQAERRGKSLAAIDGLLLVAPEEGMQALRRIVSEFGIDVLKEIEALSWRQWNEDLKLRLWPTLALELLCEVLHEAVPPLDDPKEELGAVREVTPESDFRRLGDTIPRILFERGESDDLAALARLSAKYADVSRWYSWAQANNEAASALVQSPSRDGAIPWKEVVRLLDDAQYRLIHDAADLQRVLVDELRDIAKTAREHLAMLWTSDHKRLPEDALQAYVHCRLNDRLPNRTLHQKTEVFLNREPLASSNRKFDIKVQAPTVDKGKATVVIEVKWSDNCEVSKSLVEQLGETYLVANNLTHGLYLVGWSGRWSWPRSATIAKPSPSLDGGEVVFSQQAAAFNIQHPTIVIRPVVFDLEWDKPTKPSSPGRSVPSRKRSNRTGGRRTKLRLEKPTTRRPT